MNRKIWQRSVQELTCQWVCVSVCERVPLFPARSAFSFVFLPSVPCALHFVFRKESSEKCKCIWLSISAFHLHLSSPLDLSTESTSQSLRTLVKCTTIFDWFSVEGFALRYHRFWSGLLNFSRFSFPCEPSCLEMIRGRRKPWISAELLTSSPTCDIMKSSASLICLHFISFYLNFCCSAETGMQLTVPIFQNSPVMIVSLILVMSSFRFPLSFIIGDTILPVSRTRSMCMADFIYWLLLRTRDGTSVYLLWAKFNPRRFIYWAASWFDTQTVNTDFVTWSLSDMSCILTKPHPNMHIEGCWFSASCWRFP